MLNIAQARRFMRVRLVGAVEFTHAPRTWRSPKRGSNWISRPESSTGGSDGRAGSEARRFRLLHDGGPPGLAGAPGLIGIRRRAGDRRPRDLPRDPPPGPAATAPAL